MIPLLSVWLALLVVLVFLVIGRARAVGALTLSYFLSLSLIHVPGVLAFSNSVLPIPGEEETRIGLQLTLLGMGALVAGAATARSRDKRRVVPTNEGRPLAFERLGWRAFAFGSFTYFILVPASGSTPSLTSLLSSVATLLIIGLWLRLYAAKMKRAPLDILVTLAMLPVLPLATLTAGGFIGYGVNWMLSVLSFLFIIVRRRAAFYIAAPVVVFLGLSIFVTYMGARTGIRDVVWNKHAGIADRFGQISTLVTGFQLLDVNQLEQATQLNQRLNQNYLVGAGVERHDRGMNEFQFGKTVPLWILIPRGVWSDKPEIGGGALGGGTQLITDFVGIPFSAGTSVGAGQVLEFYMNFGVAGVVVGFIALGYLLMWLDLGIMRALSTGDLRGLLVRAMPGLTLLQPGGNLAEIVVGFVAALVAAFVLLQIPFFGWQVSRKPSQPATPTGAEVPWKNG